MAEIVYILCMMMSLTCAALLYRGYRRSRTRLLLWSCLCFSGLAVNNLTLVIDLVLVPDHDLGLWRHLTGLASLSLFIIGLVWDGDHS